MKKLFNKSSGDEHNFWMSYTDLMSGFLVVFIIISAICYNHYNEQMHQAKLAERQYKEAVKRLNESENTLDSIKKHDLKNQIMKYQKVFIYDVNVKVNFDSVRGSIILTHQNPHLDLFEQGKAEMQQDLRRYIDNIGNGLVDKTMAIWKENSYKDVELRIEGHTDPTWGYNEPRGSNYSFTKNLLLSSERANNVYEYILNNTELTETQQDFVKKNMISIGYSFSTRIQQNDVDDESKDALSRRIEFRIISK